MRVLIIGAGMTGLACARRLRGAGYDPIVLDKGRAVGGRMATRRHGDAAFDHGAQHFSVRTDAFETVRATLAGEGVVDRWLETPSLTEPDQGVEPRYVGRAGMRRVPEAMAVGLEVHTQARVHRLAGDAGGVTAFTESGERFEADAVVCTAPAPQAFDLLDASGLGSDPAAREVVAELAYDPCLVVMALPAGPTALKNGHWADSAGPVAWIADNHHKGVSSVPAVTIHASAQYSTRYLEEDPSMWLPTVLGRARDVLGSDVEVVRTHRWRYSIPTTTLDVGAVEIASAPYPLWLAGEIYAGARVEGAFTSGIAAADALMART